jgi:hypothetical protein
MAPVLCDAVRFEVDKRGDTGLFILTGSAVSADNLTTQTGVGRFFIVLMRPMRFHPGVNSLKLAILSPTLRCRMKILRDHIE